MAYTQKNSPFKQVAETANAYEAAANASNNKKNEEEVIIPEKPVRTKKSEVSTYTPRGFTPQGSYRSKTPKKQKTTETTETPKTRKNYGSISRQLIRKEVEEIKKKPYKKKTPPKELK